MCRLKPPGYHSRWNYVPDTSTQKENEGLFARMIIDLFKVTSKRIADVLVKKGASLAGSSTFYVHDTEGALLEGEKKRTQRWSSKHTS